MTAVNWKDNNHSGAFVTRQLRALEPIIEKAKGPKKIAYLSRYVYLWEVKSRVAKPDKQDEEIQELRQEIADLKQLAGLAQNNQITK